MFYFTCNESKIYENLTFWNKLQYNFFILIFLDVPVYASLLRENKYEIALQMSVQTSHFW